MDLKKEQAQAYQALRQAGRYGPMAGLTRFDLEERCNAVFGKKCDGYWNKQLRALIDMGYAKKAGRVEKSGNGCDKIVWVACDPWGDDEAPPLHAPAASSSG
jgi:hypothetical protein